jgi:hypothetical protein
MSRRAADIPLSDSERQQLERLNHRRVVGRFGGGAVTTDADGLLLREVEKRTEILVRFAAWWEGRMAEPRQ